MQEPYFVKDHATLSIEWNATLNTDLDSASVSLGSSKKVWWTCPQGHNFQAIVANRSKGSGCSVCSGKTVLQGFNDIATTDPALAAEISQTRNKSGLQFEMARGSNTKIWWVCNSGHEWEATPNNRRGGKSGCPVCSNRKVSNGVNDLGTTRPELAKEFDSLKNSPKTTNDVPSNSNASFWWLCELGHSWKATLGNRVKGQGCPYCSGRRSIAGSTDLETTNPKLAAEWHPNLNGDLTPDLLKGKSHKKVWWLCEKGHSFQAHIDERARGNGCSVCAGYTVIPGINDLATTNPELAETLYVGNRQSVDASTIYAGSHQRLLWECSRGHVWSAAVFKRAAGQGCSVCSNQKLLQGFNDLATTNPALAAEFDQVKNRPLTPADIIAGTNKQLWWICELGHSWRTSGSHRVMGRGCPTCAVTGFNPTMPGLLYFIENKSMLAKKIGITNVDAKTDRLKAFRAAGWTAIATFVSDDGQKISDAETVLLRWIRKDLGLPQFLDASSMKGTGGASETFSGAISDDQVLAKIRDVISSLKVEIKP